MPFVSCIRRDVAAVRLGNEAISGVCVAVLRKTATWAAGHCIGPAVTVDRQGERVLLESRSCATSTLTRKFSWSLARLERRQAAFVRA